MKSIERYMWNFLEYVDTSREREMLIQAKGSVPEEGRISRRGLILIFMISNRLINP